MANISAAATGYKTAMIATAGPRTIEAAAFSMVTEELRTAATRADVDYPGYIAALSKNLSLWTILAADAAHSGNRLPLELRAAVIRLAAFVRGHTMRLQQGGLIGIEALVEINDNMIAGLRRSGPPRKPA